MLTPFRTACSRLSGLPVNCDRNTQSEPSSPLLGDEDGDPFDESDEVKPAPNRLAVHFSSESVEWPTPPEVLEKVLDCLGGIDLDPCADAAHTVPARHHFTTDDDGLTHDWEGRIFMNPPYGRGVIDA